MIRHKFGNDTISKQVHSPCGFLESRAQKLSDVLLSNHTFSKRQTAMKLVCDIVKHLPSNAKYDHVNSQLAIWKNVDFHGMDNDAFFGYLLFCLTFYFHRLADGL